MFEVEAGLVLAQTMLVGYDAAVTGPHTPATKQVQTYPLGKVAEGAIDGEGGGMGALSSNFVDLRQHHGVGVESCRVDVDNTSPYQRYGH